MQNQEILVNEPSAGKFIFTRLKNMLKTEAIEEVIFMVAFISVDGVYLILEELREVLAQNCKIVIISGFMNYFNNPRVFELLMNIDKLEIRIADIYGFHPKLYLVKKKSGGYSYILGSSNLTNNALRRNCEMNIYFDAYANTTLVEQALEIYQDIYSKSQLLNKEMLTLYKERYLKFKELPQILSPITELIKPNQMQKRALASLADLRQNKKQKAALIISATGSGKTYLSAFDVQAFQAKRLLFIAHRDNLLNHAINSYSQVISGFNYSKLTGTIKDFTGNYIFASVQTLQKEEYLYQFTSTAFDYIIIDEVHRAGAAGYQKIVNYFKPEFLLGMSATPQRNDSFDIYEMFQHNIAYEIRLHEALEQGLVCPFHYFGIAELAFDNINCNDFSDFNRIDYTSRVEHIISHLRLYGYDGNKVKGLVFTSRIEEAQKLSVLFNQYGYKTIVLSANDSEAVRQHAIELLSNDYTDSKGNPQEYFDYIFTVDIFNEGVDIPCVNQIVLLRPTQSAIVFVQQLGRGLRKSVNKEYCVIIDFIANYQSNFLIPVALSGSNSYNKESLRKFVSEANTLIPLNSTVSFDKITRERIYSSINSIQVNKKFIDQKYLELKQKLNRVPRLLDFKYYNSVDPKIIFKYSIKTAKIIYFNYFELLSKHHDIEENLSESEISYLNYLSQELLFAARPDEVHVLLQLIQGESNSEIVYKNLAQNYATEISKSKKISIVKNLDLTTSNALMAKYQVSFLAKNSIECLRLSDEFNYFLQHNLFRELVIQVLELGLSYFANYAKVIKYNDFILYSKYSRREVTRLLNVNLSLETSIYGYRIIKGSVPIFITYNKAKAGIFSERYENIFLDKQKFIWYSRPVINLNNKEIAGIINHKQQNLTLMIFVKKSDNEGSEHYYLGNADVNSYSEVQLKGKNVVKFVLRLQTPLPDSEFDYLIN